MSDGEILLMEMSLSGGESREIAKRIIEDRKDSQDTDRLSSVTGGCDDTSSCRVVGED